MKKLLLMIDLITSQSGYATEPTIKSDEKRILKQIEQTCLDVWCENNVDFRFSDLTFDIAKNTTTILFEILPPEYPFQIQNNRYFSSSIEQRMFKMRCEINGFSDSQSTLNFNGSLSRKFYEALSDCILSVELQIRRIQHASDTTKGVFTDWN